MRMCLLLGLVFSLHAGAEMVQIKKVPHIRQKPDFCGEACIAMYLRQLGYAQATQDWVYNQSGLDPRLGRGCATRELVTALRQIGFDPGNVGTWISVARAEREMHREWQALLKDLHDGVPSIVCMRYSDQPQTTEHFRLILGFDDERGEVIYHEPAEDDGAYRRMSLELFQALWPLKYKADRWLLIRMRLAPKKLPERIEPENGFTPADYAQHIRALKPKIPEGFTLVVQEPFVVLGDESPERVKLRAERTVGWSVKHLKECYFAKDPDEIIDVWLFRNKASYEKWTLALFEDVPTTPYGYFSSEHQALIMNIATGGGTLVHEIVHPFMDSNFPACPSWFNEGLASLYEQCGEREGRFVGFTNWRLAGLQSAINAKELAGFDWLLASTRGQFYHRHSGTNYAQARYLCYYLQEQGKLRDFYHQFVKDSAKDMSGRTTLETILGRKDLATFQKEWEAWVLKLRFPER